MWCVDNASTHIDLSSHLTSPASHTVPVEVVVTITACAFNDDLCAGGGGVSDFR